MVAAQVTSAASSIEHPTAGRAKQGAKKAPTRGRRPGAKPPPTAPAPAPKKGGGAPLFDDDEDDVVVVQVGLTQVTQRF